MAASCQKDASVKPINTPKTQDSLVNVSMINNSSIPYEVSFQGTSKYTIYLSANSRQSTSVKAGTYDIEIYPIGGSPNASSTNIVWSALLPISNPRANLNVLIPIASTQSLLIY
jgi:hypothetical protein